MKILFILLVLISGCTSPSTHKQDAINWLSLCSDYVTQPEVVDCAVQMMKAERLKVTHCAFSGEC